jgi:DNA-binding XRE family transcriptional regulator
MGKLNKEKENIFYQKVGENIRMLRKSLKITQDDLAFLLDYSRVAINNIEAGKQRLPMHLIVSMCNVLNCQLSDLIPYYKHTDKQVSDLFEERVILVKKGK